MNKRKFKEEGEMSMKISQNLPQFKDQNVLIIVAGKLGAAFYRATKGVMERMLILEADKPRFSGPSSDNLIMKEKSALPEFLRKLKEKLREMRASFASFSFSKIFIFAPGQTKNKIAEALPYDWKRQALVIEEGNYSNFHPFYILEKIKKRDNNFI